MKPHSIAGELFEIEEAGRTVILSHARWGITGQGLTLESAEKAILKTAEDLSDVYLDKDFEAVNDDAIALKEWLLKVAPYRSCGI